MAGAPDTTTAAIVGGVASLLTLVVSKWVDSGAARRSANAEQRRADHAERRESDRIAKHDLDVTEKENSDLRDRIHALQLENVVLRTTLVTHKIDLPPFIQQLLP